MQNPPESPDLVKASLCSPPAGFAKRIARAGGSAKSRIPRRRIRDRAGISTTASRPGTASVTGPELKQLRQDLGDAIGRPLSAADMAKLCGLAPGDGADTIRRWEVTGPSGPADKLLRILAMASDRHPILENFNIFDRFDIDEKDRPARRKAFREKMRDEVRERLA
jgi:DNA-binding transcriptional regulator YiaG